ncbi:MAG: hydantoinase/oxoprolinase family protein, partial [Gemmatimonadota bacterium]
FILVAFGGAGPLHACALADELGMRKVLVPKTCGVLSALGLAISDLRRDYVRPLLARIVEVGRVEIDEAFAEMERRAADDFSAPAFHRFADLRYRGQSFELTVEAGEVEGLEARFHAAHERRYGFRMDDEPVQLVTLRLVATVPGDKPKLREPPARSAPGRDPGRRANFGGEWTEVEVLDRNVLGPGSELDGPAIVEFAEATCMLRPGWSGVIDEVGTLILERT